MVVVEALVDDVVAIDGLVAGTVAAEVPVVADEPLEDDRVPAVPEFPVHVGGRHDIALVEVTVMSPKLVVADAVAEVRVVADVLEDDCVPCCMVLLTFCPQQSTLVTHPEVS
mmetsp:Transcript_20374/g.46788  ORF Transcript_20374/g.46788 Transcript_20374/m.46788 type:complete len:112 (-) Transcript_20374:504-839(-)